LRKSTRFHDKKTLDYKYLTGWSDYKKIGVRENSRVFDEHYIFIYVSQTMDHFFQSV